VLELAWAKVHSNAGASGVDGITVECFAKESQMRRLAVQEQLERGVYQPQPVKRVWIPKPGSAESGTPQGAVISPLLANIYLNPLDWRMAQNGFEMVRYADDMVVLCRSAQQAEEALKRIAEWMKHKPGWNCTPRKQKWSTWEKAETTLTSSVTASGAVKVESCGDMCGSKVPANCANGSNHSPVK
jgi:retron-type reverse transcriptase